LEGQRKLLLSQPKEPSLVELLTYFYQSFHPTVFDLFSIAWSRKENQALVSEVAKLRSVNDTEKKAAELTISRLEYRYGFDLKDAILLLTVATGSPISCDTSTSSSKQLGRNQRTCSRRKTSQCFGIVDL